MYLFIYWLHWVFVAVRGLSLVAASELSSYGARASHCGGFPCCRIWFLGCMSFSHCSSWAQQLWHIGLVAPWYVESSQTRDWTCVPCIGRQTLPGPPGKSPEKLKETAFEIVSMLLSVEDICFVTLAGALCHRGKELSLFNIVLPCSTASHSTFSLSLVF